MARCKNCQGAKTVKNGCVRTKQRDQCKECGHNFVVGDDRMKAETAVKRAFAVILYALGQSSYGLIAKLVGVTPPAVQKWLQREADRRDEPAMPGTIREMACDEMWHFIGAKNKTWIINALDRPAERTVAWVLGGRDAATFQRLYEKVTHVKGCMF